MLLGISALATVCALQDAIPRHQSWHVAFSARVPAQARSAGSVGAVESADALDWSALQHGAGPVVTAAFEFDELIASFNCLPPVHGERRFEARVAAASGAWSAWYPLLVVGDLRPATESGVAPGARPAAAAADPIARLDIDTLKCAARCTRFQLRATGRDARGQALEQLDIERVDVVVSDRAPRALPEASASAGADPAARICSIDLPFLSQVSERSELAGRLCSPTSVAMVLRGIGIDTTPLAVAERAYDPRHDVYGNWPRNVQAAREIGASAWLERYSDWSSVEQVLCAGTPLVISIGVQDGELSNAPYRATAGHLIVLRGFDERGDCLVSDPAASSATAGQRTYLRRELEHVWMRRGGTAYVIVRR